MRNDTKYALGAGVMAAGVVGFIVGFDLAGPLQHPAQVLALAATVAGGGTLYRSAKAEIRRRALIDLDKGPP